jgi:tripartite-type tricarboxylate transporter receptor subunit TctC
MDSTCPQPCRSREIKSPLCPYMLARLNREINAALADAGMKARLDDSGGEVLPGSRAEFEAIVTSEIERWAKVVKFSGARPD